MTLKVKVHHLNRTVRWHIVLISGLKAKCTISQTKETVKLIMFIFVCTVEFTKVAKSHSNQMSAPALLWNCKKSLKQHFSQRKYRKTVKSPMRI